MSALFFSNSASSLYGAESLASSEKNMSSVLAFQPLPFEITAENSSVLFEAGTVVGGIIIDKDDFALAEKRECIALTTTSGLVVRRFLGDDPNGGYRLENLSDHSYQSHVDIIKLAPIIFVRHPRVL